MCLDARCGHGQERRIFAGVREHAVHVGRALSDVHGTCNLGRRMSTGIRPIQSTGAQLWQTLSLVRAPDPMPSRRVTRKVSYT